MPRIVVALMLAALLLPGCGPAGQGSSTEGNVSTAAPIASPPAEPAKEFVGSKTCQDCHQEFHKLWVTSHHGLAMQPYTAALAKARLAPQDAPTKVGRRTYRAEIGPEQGWVREDGPAGRKDYPIAHVMGGKNVFYFLTPMERGRLQVLPVAYDVKKKGWYDVAASGVRHFPDRTDEALDWTDRMFTFNTTCFNCHVTQLKTNYDLASDTYRTTWSEPGISCESCHGSAREHVRVMSEAADPKQVADIRIIRTKEFTPAQMNDLCATCHAKLMPLSLDFVPGDRFFDHFDLVVLDHPDFYPDGRDLGENYTYTSWLMSPCNRGGKTGAGSESVDHDAAKTGGSEAPVPVLQKRLDCNHCHTPSGRMRAEANRSDQQCMPCHEQHVKNPAAHSHHPAENEGSRCVTCHMPMTRFAGMGRTDHSMRPPTPATTLAFKSPNACNLCHKDKDAAWADQWVRKWYPRDYQAEVLRKAKLLDEARRNQWQRLPEMLAELDSKTADEVYRASMVRLVRGATDKRKWPALMAAARDPSPLVRSSAAAALGDQLDGPWLANLLALTGDPSRVVRVRAAAALAPIPPEVLTKPEDEKRFRRANDDFMASVRARPDDWASHTNLGNFYSQQRDYLRAAKCFQTATTLEPRAVGAWVNASIAYSNLKRLPEAERCLRQALKVDPVNAAAHFNLGLLLAELGKMDEAEQALRAALKGDPQMAGAAYNLAVIVSKKNLDETIDLCRRAHKAAPDEPKYLHTLAFYLRQKGDTKAADEATRQAEKLGRPSAGSGP